MPAYLVQYALTATHYLTAEIEAPSADAIEESSLPDYPNIRGKDDDCWPEITDYDITNIQPLDDKEEEEEEEEES